MFDVADFAERYMPLLIFHFRHAMPLMPPFASRRLRAFI